MVYEKLYIEVHTNNKNISKNNSIELDFHEGDLIDF